MSFHRRYRGYDVPFPSQSQMKVMLTVADSTFIIRGLIIPACASAVAKGYGVTRKLRRASFKNIEGLYDAR